MTRIAAAAGQAAARSRYRDAPAQADFTIDQDWASYGSDEHDRWSRLFERSWKVLETRACTAYLDAARRLELPRDHVPDMAELSRRLEPLTGWRVVPVAELVPDEVFFDHLSSRRLPAGAFIRSEREMDYLEEPDVFHDVFGHVPLLADPRYAAFMEAYGKGGRRALQRGQLQNLARLYWYTIEFGLIRSAEGLRIFGAGILSSTAESVFALEDASPHRIAFDIERVMRTRYEIDDLQRTYFVIDSFESLLDACYRDFGPLYDRLRDLPEIEPGTIADGDAVITRGTLAYFGDRT